MYTHFLLRIRKFVWDKAESQPAVVASIKSDNCADGPFCTFCLASVASVEIHSFGSVIPRAAINDYKVINKMND